MARTDAGDRVCLNHPARVATARCAHCQKPVCAECCVVRHDTNFCSGACANARAVFQHRETQRAQRGKQRERFGVGEWGLRAALLLLGGGILYYVLILRNVRSVGDLLGMLRTMF